MKKNLRLVWCQIDVDGGGQHRHFEHDGGMAVPRRVVRILSAVVLPQQLTREKKKHIRDLSECLAAAVQASRNDATTCFQFPYSSVPEPAERRSYRCFFCCFVSYFQALPTLVISLWWTGLLLMYRKVLSGLDELVET